MLQEALVIFACANSHGCSEVSSHYYNTHPEVRQMIEMNEKRISEVFGPFIVENVGPLIYIGFGGTSSFRLGKNFSLQTNKESVALTFSKEF